MSQSKTVSLGTAAFLVKNGDCLAIGGGLYHRTPCAFVRELARQEKKDLEVIKHAGNYEIDLLAAAGCLRKVQSGYVAFENEFGIAPNYRQAVEAGRIKVVEHSCHSINSGFRAAISGVPFMPVAGLEGSDVPKFSDFREVDDPYNPGRKIYVVKKIQPDWTVLHVQEADDKGNARIIGPVYEDLWMAKAAKSIILTAEKIIPEEEIERHPDLTGIPYFMVKAVVHTPMGALPAGCYPYYEYDREGMKRYLDASGDSDRLLKYLWELDLECGKEGVPKAVTETAG